MGVKVDEHGGVYIDSKPILIASDFLKKQQMFIGIPTILIPFLGFLYGGYQVFTVGIGWLEISLLVGMYVLTTLALVIGFHRLLTHKAFKTSCLFGGVLAALGSMGAQGPVINWVANHRRHHRFSDVAGDMHSPHVRDNGEVHSGVNGFIRAHVLWLFEGKVTNAIVFCKDLIQDPYITKVNQTYLFWVFLGLFIPSILGYLVVGNLTGAFQGFLWGGLVRLALGHQAIWCIAAAAHVWGTVPYETGDNSKNNPWVSLILLGDGWHSNHHAFPKYALGNFNEGEYDFAGMVIKLMAKLGLIWDVHWKPNAEQLARKRRQPNPLLKPNDITS